MAFDFGHLMFFVSSFYNKPKMCNTGHLLDYGGMEKKCVPYARIILTQIIKLSSII